MVKIKPFRGIRPPRKYAAEVASRPYDVLNSQEAKKEALPKNRCSTSSSRRSISSPIDRRALRGSLPQGRRELPVLARARVARPGRRGEVLRLCADDGRPYAVRAGRRLSFRRLCPRQDQEARADASRQGGGPYDSRAESERQYRARVFLLSGQCRNGYDYSRCRREQSARVRFHRRPTVSDIVSG